MPAILKDVLRGIFGLAVADAGTWWEFVNALADRFGFSSSRWRVVLLAAAIIAIAVPLILASIVESGATVWVGTALAHFCVLAIGGCIGHTFTRHGTRTTT